MIITEESVMIMNKHYLRANVKILEIDLVENRHTNVRNLVNLVPRDKF